MVNRNAIIYVVFISLARAILVPDFRYDLISILAIQLAYPSLLLLPLMQKRKSIIFWKYYLVGIAGIVVAELIAFRVYLIDAGSIDSLDNLTIPLKIASFIAQIVLFTIFVLIYFGWSKFSAHRKRIP